MLRLGTVSFWTPLPNSGHASRSTPIPHAAGTVTDPPSLVNCGIQGQDIPYSACKLDDFTLIDWETFVKRDSEDCSRLKLAQQLQVWVLHSVKLVTFEKFGRRWHCQGRDGLERD